MEFFHSNNKVIKGLVHLAVQGHYPLFERNWMDEFIDLHSKRLTGNEKAKAKTLFKKLCEQQTLERQRTVFWAMSESDRLLFKKAFYKMVENKILDQSSELQ